MNPSTLPIDYLKAFLGGVGISFTPCVYPLMPVVIGYIGIKASTKRMRGFTLSFTYVTGVAITYSILGLIASLTGKIFGVVSSHPLSYIFVGSVIIFFGLSMFDLFTPHLCTGAGFTLPLLRLIKLPNLRQKNYFSIFLLGLSSGLIIGPCTAPALGAILSYVATKKNILYGATLLLSFAYGMGLVLIIAGTFSTILISLPKSGRWMIYIKRVCALVLVGMGIYFIVKGIGRM